MTLQEMIARLIALGLSQGAIAKFCGTTQPNISRAARGSSVSYEIGKSIESLLAAEERKSKRKTTAVAA